MLLRLLRGFLLLFWLRLRSWALLSDELINIDSHGILDMLLLLLAGNGQLELGLVFSFIDQHVGACI